MPGRSTNGDKYRYGYNGMEKDNELKGVGNSYTTEFRQYDPRLGRWLSLDPMMMEFPNISPYVAFNDNPILFTDPLGLEPGDGDKKTRREERRAESRAAKLTPDEKAELEHQKAPNKVEEVVITPAKKGLVTLPAAAVEVQTMTKTVTSIPKPAPVMVLARWSLLTLPLAIPGDTRKTTVLYDTDKLQVGQNGSTYYVVPKPGVKVSPKEKEVLEEAQKLLDRGGGDETDVYVLTARVKGKHYECKSCITCKGSNVELKVNEIAKFGITGRPTRYSKGDLKYLKQTNLLEDVPRDVARAFEKIFIVNYTLGGYGDQRGELESRGIYTTFGKPIQNPIFR
jgi:RHS repeat-associated protein